MKLLTTALAAAILLIPGLAKAQFSGSIVMMKKQHLAGEPVNVKVTITNYSGEEQVLGGGRVPWISFLIKTINGNPVMSRPAQFNPKPVLIGAGQSLAREFDLSEIVQLDQAGNYTVAAIIRPPNENMEGTGTNREFFEIRSGNPIWSQKVGGDDPKSLREYRLVQFNGPQGAQLYVQLLDGHNSRILTTVYLGGALMMHTPTCKIDSQRHLQVLFRSSPSIWVHYRINPEGIVAQRTFHRMAAVGDPRLLPQADGSVQVINSIPFDPEADAKARGSIRKISDRPE